MRFKKILVFGSILPIGIVSTVLVSSCSYQQKQETSNSYKDITLFTTNDVHGRLVKDKNENSARTIINSRIFI